MINLIKNNKMYLLFMFIALFISIIPAINIFTFDFGHDGIGQMMMYLGVKDNLLSGNFRPYINERYYNGLGGIDPIVYPFVYKYILAILHILFNNVNITMNLFIIIIQVLNIVIMYKSTYTITQKKFAAVISAIFWQLFLYRLYNVYERKALAECFALVFYPLVIAGFHNIFFGDKKKWYYLVISLSLIAESHVITTFYTVILLVIFSIVFSYKIIKDKKIFFILLKVTIFTLLINLFFYIPFLQYYTEKKVNATIMGSKLEYFPSSIGDIFFPFNPHLFNEFNKLGIESIPAYIFIIILSIYLIIKLINNKSINNESQKNIITFIILSFLAVLHYINYRQFFNDEIIRSNSLLNYIFSKEQWTYREIGRGGIYLAISLGIGLDMIKLPKKILLSILLIVCCITSLPFQLIKTKNKYIVNDNIYFIDMDYRFLPPGHEIQVHPECSILFSQIDFKPIEKTDKEKKEFIDNNKYEKLSNIKPYRIGYCTYQINYNNANHKENKYYIDVPLYYYNGYTAIDCYGEKIKIIPNHLHKIRVIMPSYDTIINVFFDPPIHWVIANIISLTTIVLFILYLFINSYGNKFIIILNHKVKKNNV